MLLPPVHELWVLAAIFGTLGALILIGYHRERQGGQSPLDSHPGEGWFLILGLSAGLGWGLGPFVAIPFLIWAAWYGSKPY